MHHLKGNNIRQGISLDVPIEEIFKPDETPIGNKTLKHYAPGISNSPEAASFLKLLKEQESCIEYREVYSRIVLNETVGVTHFTNYTASYSKFSKNKIDYKIFDELIFYSKKTLTFEDFCFNFMAAQAHTGHFKESVVQHCFSGIGDFDIESIACVLPLAIAGNLSLEHFFIYYKGVLASIDNIISGQIENDIEEQKEHLTKEEYGAVLKEATEHQEAIRAIYEKQL